MASDFQYFRSQSDFFMNTSTGSAILTYAETGIIRELVNCALTCEACATACLKEQEDTHLARCGARARDCSDICLHASRLVMRHSEIAGHYLAMCEEMCRLCHEECSKHQHDYCMICAEACESCADTCEAYTRERE